MSQTNNEKSKWTRYLRSCDSLGYDPDYSCEDRLHIRYKILYERYCRDNNIPFDVTKQLSDYADIGIISRLLFLDLCEELGYELIVKIRRNISDLKQSVYDRFKYHRMNEDVVHQLGSRAEGLRMEKSDIDMMIVRKNNIIVNDIDEIIYLNPSTKKDVFVMERSFTNPGYVRLRYVPQFEEHTSSRSNTQKFLYLFGGVQYLSSVKFREEIIPQLGADPFVHGPCSSVKHGHRDTDLASCLCCSVLPTEMLNWKERCDRLSWPKGDLLTECMSLECQLAPVSSKVSSNEELEWRISFAIIEKQLTFSLNHVQFMCYGMLKIYLTEVLNDNLEDTDLITSYVMKTALFWEIQTSSKSSWSAEDLLFLFKGCIDRLYSWVLTENCPNFFIPENNMFANKMSEINKTHLRQLFKDVTSEKFYGLNRCRSVDFPYIVFQALANEQQGVTASLTEDEYLSRDDIECHTWNEITGSLNWFHHTQSYMNDLQKLLHVLNSMLNKDIDNLSDLQQKALKAWMNEVNVYITTHNSKKVCKNDKKSSETESLYTLCCKSFRAFDHPGSVAPFYLATLMYNTGHYQSCLDVIIESNKRINEGYLHVVFFTSVLGLSELRLELETSVKRDTFGIDGTFLQIDPSVYGAMLSVLCYFRLQNSYSTEYEFQLLKEICSENQNRQIFSFREISWQILGICAETIGKFKEAYQCYLSTLKSRRFFLTDKSAIVRILCLLCRLLCSKK